MDTILQLVHYLLTDCFLQLQKQHGPFFDYCFLSEYYLIYPIKHHDSALMQTSRHNLPCSQFIYIWKILMAKVSKVWPEACPKHYVFQWPVAIENKWGNLCTMFFTIQVPRHGSTSKSLFWWLLIVQLYNQCAYMMRVCGQMEPTKNLLWVFRDKLNQMLHLFQLRS